MHQYVVMVKSLANVAAYLTLYAPCIILTYLLHGAESFFRS